MTIATTPTGVFEATAPLGGSLRIGTPQIIDLSPAQLVQLASVPVPVVVAPGEGYVTNIISASFQYKAGSAPFSVPATLKFFYEAEDSGWATNQFPFDDSVSHWGQFAPGSNPSPAITLRENKALMLQADVNPGAEGAILTSSLDSPGVFWLVGDAMTLSGGNPGATGTVVTIANGFLITAVNQGAKTFRIAGDHVAAFPVGQHVQVYRSTGNDNTYEIAVVSLVTGNTVIEVVEAIPDATVDGALGNVDAGAVGQIDTYSLSSGGGGYGVGQSVEAEGVHGQQAADIDIDSITNVAADGQGRLMIFYMTMPLL